MSKQTKNAKSDDFISSGAVSSGAANYLKLGEDTVVRLISKPVEGFVEWVDKKPIRTPLVDGEPEASDDENPPKKFIAVVVVDRDDESIKILELTQQSVIKAIRALAVNPAWGNPFSYDLTIDKKGEGLKTKYTVTPSPKKALPKEVIKAATAKPCNLERLFDGEDPWKLEKGEESTEYFFK